MLGAAVGAVVAGAVVAAVDAASLVGAVGLMPKRPAPPALLAAGVPKPNLEGAAPERGLLALAGVGAVVDPREEGAVGCVNDSPGAAVLAEGVEPNAGNFGGCDAAGCSAAGFFRFPKRLDGCVALVVAGVAADVAG